MVERFVNRRLNLWKQNGDISEDDFEIIEYGMVQGIYSITGIVCTLLLAMCFDSVSMGILFSLYFMPLRSCAGGYHAETRTKCSFLSLFILMIGFLFVKYCSIHFGAAIIITLFLSIAILCLSPKDNPNHRLEASEKKQLKKKTAAVLFLEWILLLVLIYCKVSMAVNLMLVSHATVFVLLVAAYVLDRDKACGND